MGFGERHELCHIFRTLLEVLCAALKSHFGNHARAAVLLAYVVHIGKHGIHHVGDCGRRFVLARKGIVERCSCLVLRVNRHSHYVVVHFIALEYVESKFVFAHIHTAVEVDNDLSLG